MRARGVLRGDDRTGPEAERGRGLILVCCARTTPVRCESFCSARALGPFDDDTPTDGVTQSLSHTSYSRLRALALVYLLRDFLCAYVCMNKAQTDALLYRSLRRLLRALWRHC